jgi:secretion/DNA translocation related TadE-like protein
VWIVVLLGLVAMSATVVLVVGHAVAQRHRAATAADLAALAAAERVLSGPAEACARAATVARAHGGMVESCQSAGTSVEVVVALPGEGLLGTSMPARARARAEIGAPG